MNQIENTLTSLEVAEMVGKKHSELMKDIRRYIGYLNEGKIPPVEFFIESTYQDSKNETRPNFLLTKQGCEMVSNKITGSKGVQFTAKYVSRFNQMEQHIKQQPDISNLSPELQMFNQMFQAVANQEQKLVEVSDKVDNISNIVALNTTNWREDSNSLIRKISQKVGGDSSAYSDIRKEIYSEVDRRAGSKLKVRLTNKRRLMAEEGVSKSRRDKVNYLDVIDDDKRLKEIYIAVVKDFAIKYQVDVV
ncbi:Rha family transcriptional regulator [Lactococcus lactis]|uniref:Rha family transcriptional regulator n=1 Tax=Lactococcus lactis TaxID=1358 RepID=A0AAP3Z0F1_9LACT|nr:Rha family transcriptional regulator [Lactococcus lactis]MDG4976074.1 Rha family transcriptional regulator [Lactococcus lactis]